MDLRDKNNTFEDYKNLLDNSVKYIIEDENHIKELEKSEKNGVQMHSISNKQVIQNELDDIYKLYYEIFFIKYSMGEIVSELIDDYVNVINSMEYSWRKESGYVQMANMISVGILLDIGINEFNKLVTLIGNDNPKDYLIDLLINYKIPKWERINKKFMWKKPYQAFEEIDLLAKDNKKDAVMRLKKYLQKQWLPANDVPKSRGKSYHSGYWSFESGAIVKILELDDAIIKDLNYYPYDMVHWKK